MTIRPAALLVTLFATLLAPPGQARDRHVLWTVAGKHNTVYLLGSIHVLRPGDGGLPQAAERAYDDAEQLVMEIDMDDAAAADPNQMLASMQRAALLPEGATLRGVLGDDYASIRERAAQSGLDLEPLDRFAPWFVATLMLQLELAKRGFLPELGIEQQLASRAAGDGKPIQGLETAEQQFAVLGGLPLAEQKRFLLMTMEESTQLDAQVEELVGAWQRGDTTALAAMLSDEFDEFPELYRPLTEDRNRAWVQQLDRLLDDRDDYLVVVGALHLVGRNSVVDLLRLRGYTVTRQ
jgi:uncharacterized protein YbaP (TraB family)